MLTYGQSVLVAGFGPPAVLSTSSHGRDSKFRQRWFSYAAPAAWNTTATTVSTH